MRGSTPLHPLPTGRRSTGPSRRADATRSPAP